MRPPSTALIFGLLLIGVPLATAQSAEPKCIVFLTPDKAFTEITFRADLLLNESQRLEEARTLDADQDGNVTREEVDKADLDSQRFYRGAAELGSRAIWIDERAPNVTLIEKRHTGWSGPVESANGTLEERRDYRYDPGPSLNGENVFVVRGGEPLPPAYNPRPVVETVRFTAPPGLVVYDVQYGNASQTFKTPFGEIPHFDLKASWRVNFAPVGVNPYGLRGGGGMPGPALWAVLAGLTLAAIVRARRPR